MSAEFDRDWDDDEVPTLKMHRERREPGARVLVVDDDVEMRFLVTTTLAAEGFEIDEAGSGTELLHAFERLRLDRGPLDGVDLIVLDLRMPGMNGLEVVRRLRAADSTTPAILMTAFAEPEIYTEAATLGVPVLSKPFPLEALTKTAVSLLMSRVHSSDERDPRLAQSS